MPLIKSHSRLFGDLASRRAAILLSSLTLVPIVLIGVFIATHTAPVSISQPEKAAGLAMPFSAALSAADIKGVDLFAFAGMSEPRKKLYVLSSVDRVIYDRIFEAQKKSDWPQAKALTKRLHDPLLMGHILYERYMSDDYQATYEELRNWMVEYGDHPQAYKVYQLAQKRRNNDPAALPAPQLAKKLFGSMELSWLSKRAHQPKASPKPLKRDEAQISDLMRDIKDKLSNDKVTAAYDQLGKSKVTRMLSAVEYDSMLGEIAANYYYNDKRDTALRVAEQATKRSDTAVPVAHWIAGLASWQKADYRKAAAHFEAVTYSPSRNPWMLSAGAFWASRSHQKMGDKAMSKQWLKEAASYPRTFYGLISQARLGENELFSWKEPHFDVVAIHSLKTNDSGRRALALLDAGQQALAQSELLQIHPNGDKKMEQALVASAHHFKLPALALRLGNAVNQPDGKLYDVALYPVVPWKGDTSLNVDPALINALIRQESQFDTNASNGSGAKGLMQLMPSTAQLVSDKSFDAKDLHNPDVNVALGQRYVAYLLKTPVVSGNLIYLAAAYNAGPGNLVTWKKEIEYEDDPLLFVESLPFSETRGFIQRVMTNYWIYGQRLSKESATLDAVSTGEWPIYKLPEDNGLKMASSAL